MKWIAIGFALLVPPVFGQDWLETIDESLFIESADGRFRADLTGFLDLEGYYSDQPPPALLFPDDDLFFNPRLSLFLDTHFGDHWYGLVQVRFDRGFDPGAREDGDARFDEYLIRYTPFDDSRLNFQLGKFATVIGNWVPRHLSWENPFVTAPLPYENVLIVTDHVAPAGPDTFLARRRRPDQKAIWLPLIWGPSYATGGSVFGLINGFEYALEIKNASISSRPYAWDADNLGWDDPTFSARFGHRPNATWNYGLSMSHGAYLLPPAESTLPPGKDLSDFPQTTLGADLTYAWRHWQLWGELFLSRFDIPNVGNADTLAYYVEAKYKFTPHLFAAARWNQQLFDSIRAERGGLERWDRDIWRVDAGIGYRFTRYLQAKIQYSLSQQNGLPDQGVHLLAGQFTVRF